jgi:hypothetical protein
MDVREEIIRGLNAFSNTRKERPLLICQVISYNENDETIDVLSIADDAQIEGVSLKVVTDTGTEGVVIVPQIGSFVIVSELQEGFLSVLQHSKVQKVKSKIGTLEIEMDGTGISIKKGTQNIKTLFDELFDNITQSFTAIQAVIGVPANTAQYALLKAKFAQIFK